MKNFFSDANNYERMFVYVAEAIRFPSLFGKNLNNQEPGLYFPMYECWENHFTKWDDFSKHSIARLILEKLTPEQRSTFKDIPDNAIASNKNTEKAEKLVKSLKLVRVDGKEENLQNNSNTRTYIDDVILELRNMIKLGS